MIVATEISYEVIHIDKSLEMCCLAHIRAYAR